MLYRDEITNTNKKGNNKDTKYFEYKQKVWMQVRLLYRYMDDLWESEICIYVDAEISIFTRWLTIVLHRNLQYSWTSQTSGIQMAHNQMTQNLFQFLLYKTKQVVNQLLPRGNRAWTSREYKIKHTKQESIPVECVPPIFLILVGANLPTETPWTETPLPDRYIPGQRLRHRPRWTQTTHPHPRTETPLGQRLPRTEIPLDRVPPSRNMGPGTETP